MIFTTPTQYAVLLLMLIVGWLFGLASHPGGKKWRQAYRDEQAERAREVAALKASNTELLAERDSARAAANAHSAAGTDRPVPPPRP